MNRSRAASQHAAVHPFRLFATIAAALAVILALLLAPSLQASAATQTVFSGSTPTRLVEHSDRQAVSLGTKFSVRSDGNATGMSFWKQRGDTGTHTGTLWSSSGTALATVRFTQETAAGWQKVTFSTPVALKAGRTYVVSYHTSGGPYAATHHYTPASKSPDIEIKKGAGVYRYGKKPSFPTHTYRDSQYWVDVEFSARGSIPAAPKPTATPTATPKPTAPAPKPTATPTPTATPKPTAPAPKPTATPSQPTAPGSFPNADTTGVPAGTSLTAYTGPCTITAANTVIDAKQVDCSLSIRAKGVVISRSVVNGTVYADTNGSASFAISDSNVNIGAREGTGIGDGYFTATRVEVTGGNRSINCFTNCTVERSYVHGQFTDATGKAHESGIRMGSGSVIRGNTIACDAPDVPPDAGCSAALTGYGDFAVVQNNTIDGNYFVAGSGGYCAYGGSSAGKPYSQGVNNIKYTNNVFQRGSRACGYYGPITSFDSKAPGNVWSNNTWDDGKPVAPAN